MPAAVYDAYAWSNITATAFPNTGAPTSSNNGTPGTATTLFQLKGGKYELAVVATTWSGATVTLNKLAPDGVKRVAVGTAVTLTADGGGIIDTGPGLYELTITSGPPVGVYAEISRIPQA